MGHVQVRRVQTAELRRDLPFILDSLTPGDRIEVIDGRKKHARVRAVLVLEETS